MAAGHEGLADGERRLHMPGGAPTGEEGEGACRATPDPIALPSLRPAAAWRRAIPNSSPTAHEGDDQGGAAVGDEREGDARHGQGVETPPMLITA